MSKASRQAEANDASAAFQFALAQIGAATVEEALDLWKSVNPADLAATSGGWLRRAIALIISRRRMSRDLAFAYYRLARALRTGKTIADPYHPLKTHPTLGDIRREFASMIEDIDLITTPEQHARAEEVTQGIEAPSQELELFPKREGDDEVLETEEIPGLLDDEDALEAAVHEEITVNLQALGPDGLKRRLDSFPNPKDLTAEQMDAIRREAHKASGSRQSAAAERIVLDGGRGSLWAYAGKDKRVVGYARMSATGTPCGWCAMLISRGAVYKNAKTASLGEDGDLYHDNCHCYAEPIFSREQYESDPRFDLNREYQELWPKVTAGYGGKDAVAIWRKFIRERKAQASASE